jgi:cytochrome b
MTNKSMKVRVWDLPTRLFHWALATLVIAAIVTVKIGGNAMQWHFYCGYAVLCLLAFRLLWGILGTRFARFSSFIFSPVTIVKHVGEMKDGRAQRYLGHTPIGSLSVLSILLVVLLQASSGLFSNDDIASEGPLVKFISKETSDKFSWFHSDVNAWLIYGLIGLHIAAVVFYYFRKKEDLVTPMLTGDKEWHEATDVRDSWGKRILALVLLGICATGVYYLVNA